MTTPHDLVSRKEALAALEVAWESARSKGRLWGMNELHYAKDIIAALPVLETPPPTQVRLDLERLLAIVGKMRDDWADGDAAVKKALWSDLHTFAGELEARYEILGAS
jgi:hypothetical protein